MWGIQENKKTISEAIAASPEVIVTWIKAVASGGRRVRFKIILKVQMTELVNELKMRYKSKSDAAMLIYNLNGENGGVILLR